jgi:hypothetical protein
MKLEVSLGDPDKVIIRSDDGPALEVLYEETKEKWEGMGLIYSGYSLDVFGLHFILIFKPVEMAGVYIQWLVGVWARQSKEAYAE